MSQTPFENLTAAQDLIRDPRNWTQEFFARDVLGNATSVEAATCFCTVGALASVAGYRVGSQMPTEAPEIEYLARAIPDYSPGRSRLEQIFTFNDTHTHAEVMILFERAKELAHEDAA